MLERVSEKDRHPCNCSTCNLKKKIQVSSFVFGAGAESLNLGHKCIITGLYCEGNYEYLYMIDKIGCASHPLWLGSKEKQTLMEIKKHCEEQYQWGLSEMKEISKQCREGTFPEELNPDIHHGIAQGTCFLAGNIEKLIKKGENEDFHHKKPKRELPVLKNALVDI